MQSDPNWLVYNGHCHAFLKNGPFIIGRDFDAPAPAGRAFPNIKPSSNDFIKMNACLAKVVPHGNANSASERELFSDVMAEHALEKGVSEALNLYLSDCEFQPDEKTIRAQIKLLRGRIKRFKSQLPKAEEALSKFVHDSYTGEAFLRDELKPSEDNLVTLQEKWNQRYGFKAAGDTLDVMLRYVSAAEKCLGKRKPRNHRVLTLVQSLAKVWHERTRTWPKSGRNWSHSKQAGPFADFVRIVNDILPKRYRAKSLDAAIRTVCR